MNVFKQSWTLISPNTDLHIYDEVLLQNDEHHYVTNVLRLPKNSDVEITNGIGVKAFGKVISTTKKESRVSIKKIETSQPPNVHVHLLLAQLKTTALEEAVQLTSEIGISSVHVFRSENTLSKQAIKQNKLQKIAYEALRISKSSFVTNIYVHNNLNSTLQQIFEKYQDSCFIFCDENSRKLFECDEIAKKYKNIFVCIGPEASFSPAERKQLTELYHSYNGLLSNNILRAPTAAVCASYSFLNAASKNSGENIYEKPKN